MQNLFIFNPADFSVDINPELTFIAPFKKLINRDRSKYKDKAKAELAYIFFMCDYKSPYISKVDLNQRRVNIIESLDGLGSDWKEDKVVSEAMDFYLKNNESVASLALETQRNNVDKLLRKIGDFIDSEDVNEIQKAVSISEKIGGLIDSIDKLEKVVRGERESKERHRGSQSKAMFEDGDF